MKLPWTESAWTDFQQRVSSERLAHALLVNGQKGTGKSWLAHQIANYALCLEPVDGACGKCRSCRLLEGGAHPDFFVVEPEEGKSIIKIVQVRKVLDSLNLTTSISPRKVALFLPAEAMNINAANALLKSLEEPPGETLLLLVSHDPARLPITIRSRCQNLPVTPPDVDEASKWVSDRTGKTEVEVRRALEAGGGSPLQAVTLLETGQSEEYARIQSALSRLLGKPSAAGQCAALFSDFAPELLWNWLSISSASAFRAQLAGEQSPWLKFSSKLNSQTLAKLQSRADRNRRIAGTSVRQDLLLQEWLLEWASQPDEGSAAAR